MTERITARFSVNGAERETEISVRSSLADVLRDQLGLTGTNLGCEHGVCGSCTVLVDGATVRSCIMLAAQAEGREIVTVEGLSPLDGSLSPLQCALADAGGLQCGFCTPGMVVSATEYLECDGREDDHAIREALSGNLCRCTGYEGIVSAVRSLADEKTAQRVTPTPSAVAPNTDDASEQDRPAVPPLGAICPRWDTPSVTPGDERTEYRRPSDDDLRLGAQAVSSAVRSGWGPGFAILGLSLVFLGIRSLRRGRGRPKTAPQ